MAAGDGRCSKVYGVLLHDNLFAADGTDIHRVVGLGMGLGHACGRGFPIDLGVIRDVMPPL